MYGWSFFIHMLKAAHIDHDLVALFIRIDRMKHIAGIDIVPNNVGIASRAGAKLQLACYAVSARPIHDKRARSAALDAEIRIQRGTC